MKTAAMIVWLTNIKVWIDLGEVDYYYPVIIIIIIIIEYCMQTISIEIENNWPPTYDCDALRQYTIKFRQTHTKKRFNPKNIVR